MIIAGGTDLLDLMKLKVMAPDVLVDIDRLGLGGIEASGDSFRIDALVPDSDLAADRTVRRDYPVLAQALLAGASGQLRNKAITGGNLLERTRCYRFTDTAMACNKRAPGSGCVAMEGFNRVPANPGAGAPCIATHPRDLAVAMLAPKAEIEGPDGARRVPLDDFQRRRGDTPERETVLAPGELIAAEMPSLPVARVSAVPGDSDLPAASGSGGSSEASSSGSSVFLACEAIRDQLCRRLGRAAEDLMVKDGHAIHADISTPPEAILDGGSLAAEGRIEPGAAGDGTRKPTCGACFAEVAVSAVTGETRSATRSHRSRASRTGS